MATIFRAGAGDVDPDIVGMRFEDHDPGRDPTIGAARPVEEYIQQEYRYVASNRRFIPDQIREFCQTYGDQIHEVRGNGDCGMTAFAGALIYCMSEDPAKAEQLVSLITGLNPDPGLQADIEEVMGPLFQMQSGRDDQFRDELLQNRSFSLALSRVVRAIGNSQIPVVMAEEMRAMQMDPATFANAWIPPEATEEVSIEAFSALSKIFGLRIHVKRLEERPDFAARPNPIIQYPYDGSIADIAIFRKGAHYLFVVPDKERQERHGLEDAAPLRQAVAAPDNDERIEHVARGVVAAARNTQQERGIVGKVLIGVAGVGLAAAYTLLFTDIGKDFINSFF